MKKLYAALSLILLILTGNCFGNDKDTTTGRIYTKVQVAGNIGLISAGAGYGFFDNRFPVDISLGWLPKHINGVRVLTFSVKPSLVFASVKLLNTELQPYVGTGLNYSIGRNIYGKIPDYYEQDYYWPNAFSLNPFTGLSIGRIKAGKRKLYFFTELGTVDYMIWFAYKNREIGFTEIWNICFGIKIRR